jgi:hypothetical protein
MKHALVVKVQVISVDSEWHESNIRYCFCSNIKNMKKKIGKRQQFGD